MRAPEQEVVRAAGYAVPVTSPGSDQAERPDEELPARSPTDHEAEPPAVAPTTADLHVGTVTGTDPTGATVRDPATTEATSTETTIIETSSTDTAPIDTAPVDGGRTEAGLGDAGRIEADRVGTGLIDAPEGNPRAAHVDVEHVGLVQQVIRYFGTGVMSAVVDFGLLLILMAVGIGYTPAKAASFIVGTITAYSLNRRFTFKAQPSKRRFVLTMLTYVITFALQVGIFSKLFPLLAQEHLPRLVVQTVSFVFGQGAATIANFSLQRWLIFRPTETPVREAGAAAVD